jgi:hypothetical protein
MAKKLANNSDFAAIKEKAILPDGLFCFCLHKNQ